MVKSETRRDAKILVKNANPRLLGKRLRDSKRVKTSHAKRFQDFEILVKFSNTRVFRGIIRHPSNSNKIIELFSFLSQYYYQLALLICKLSQVAVATIFRSGIYKRVGT